MNARLEHMFVFVRVTGENMCVEWFEKLVKPFSVGDGDARGWGIAPDPHVAAAENRNVCGNNDWTASLNSTEIGGKPCQLFLCQVAEVVGSPPEDIVDYNLVHRAAVEGIVRRPELPVERGCRQCIRHGGLIHVVVAQDLKERDPHLRDATFIARI